MYSLIVTSDSAAWEQNSHDFEIGRMYEYTADNVKAKVQRNLRDAVLGHPVLFAYESYVKQSARVGWIEQLEMGKSYASITYRWDPLIPPIDHERLSDIRGKFGIADWELNRTHWAFKDLNLAKVLVDLGIIESHIGAVASTPLSTRTLGPQDFIVPALQAHGVPGALAVSSPASIAPPGASTPPLRLSAIMQGMAESAGIMGEPASASATPALPVIPAPQPKPKVFIVHGRASDFLIEVTLFLTRLGIEPVILHEQANQGRTIIAKFEEHAKEVAFAVVLMTPDDEGALVGSPMQKRARQNVIFEHGYFVAKLGASKVCALVKGDIEKPSDISGVLYVQADQTAHWKVLLARELDEAGVPADYSKVMRA